MHAIEDRKRKRFLQGMLLAWVPIVVFLVPTVIGFLQMIQMTRAATGLGAVVSGLSQAFALSGVLFMLVFQVAAIVLLSRSFGSGNGLQSVSAALSILCSVLMIVFTGLAMWWATWMSRQLLRP